MNIIMNLKKVVAIVVVFSLAFCSCGKKIPDMVQRDSNTSGTTPDPKDVRKILEERRNYNNFIYYSDPPEKIKPKDNYYYKGKMNSCPQKSKESSCCLKNFGLKRDVYCIEWKKKYTDCLKELKGRSSGNAGSGSDDVNKAIRFMYDSIYSARCGKQDETNKNQNKERQKE